MQNFVSDIRQFIIAALVAVVGVYATYAVQEKKDSLFFIDYNLDQMVLDGDSCSKIWRVALKPDPKFTQCGILMGRLVNRTDDDVENVDFEINLLDANLVEHGNNGGQLFTLQTSIDPRPVHLRYELSATRIAIKSDRIAPGGSITFMAFVNQKNQFFGFPIISNSKNTRLRNATVPVSVFNDDNEYTYRSFKILYYIFGTVIAVLLIGCGVLSLRVAKLRRLGGTNV